MCTRPILGGIEDLGELFRQAFDEPLQGLHVGQPLAFRAFAKALVLGLALLLVQRFDEQMGPLEHPFPLLRVRVPQIGLLFRIRRPIEQKVLMGSGIH